MAEQPVGGQAAFEVRRVTVNAGWLEAMLSAALLLAAILDVELVDAASRC